MVLTSPKSRTECDDLLWRASAFCTCFCFGVGKKKSIVLSLQPYDINISKIRLCHLPEKPTSTTARDLALCHATANFTVNMVFIYSKAEL